jgi:hypothetical protein
VEVVLAGLKTTVDVAANRLQKFEGRRSRRIGFNLMRIARFSDNQDEFDLT